LGVSAPVATPTALLRASTRRAGRRAAPVFVAVVALSLVYLGTRLVDLAGLPVFYDEADYTVVAIALGRAPLHTNPFLLMTYWGVPPLYTWVAAWPATAAANPLLAARLVSVVVGLVGLPAVLWCGWAVGGRSTGLLAGLFYVVSPFLLFFQRMALVDPLLTTVSAYALAATIEMVRQPHMRAALLLGICLSLAVLTKATGPLLFSLPAVALACTHGQRRQVLRYALVAWVIGAAAELLLFTVSDSGAMVGILSQHHQSASYIRLVVSSLSTIGVTLWVYCTPPVFLLALWGVRTLWRTVEGRVIAAWFVLAGAPFLLVHEGLTSRYLLPMVVPLVVLAARGAVALGVHAGEVRPFRPRHGGQKVRALLAVAAVSMVVVLSAWQDAPIVNDARAAALTPDDRAQYIDRWPAGYAIEEALRVIRRDAQGRALDLVVSSDSRVGNAVITLTIDDGSTRTLVRGLGALTCSTVPRATGRATYIITLRPFDPTLNLGRLGLHLLARVPDEARDAVVDVYAVSSTPSCYTSSLAGAL